MKKEPNSGQDRFSILFESINQPYERVQKNCDQLKMIAENLEAGKYVAPKKIKKLAGSISYWNDQFKEAGVRLLVTPLETLRANVESNRARSLPKEDPPQITR